VGRDAVRDPGELGVTGDDVKDHGRVERLVQKTGAIVPDRIEEIPNELRVNPCRVM
jgi:hypothetical protein